ncbi:sugar phosphate isomerase/epimerase [Candidatus Poribacteria bacterium]|nr:sugar phosphate isomerase/epimerase [Candidatus Poribacteria bacterium]
MVIGIPAGASGARLDNDEGVQSLLSYCETVGVRHVAVGAPMKDGQPHPDALIQLKETLTNAGLVIYAGGCFFGREGDFFAPAVRSAQREELEKLIVCYGKEKVDPLTVFCGVKPSDEKEEDEIRWKLAVDFLRGLVNIAEGSGVRLAVHTLTNSVFNRYATIERLFDEIPSDYLGVCYDIAIHTQLGDDLPMNFNALRSKMFLMHLRTIGDVTPSKTLELVDGKLQPAAQRKQEVNFPASIRALLNINYDGILSLEHQTGPIAYARTVGYIKGLIEAIQT